MNRFKVSLPLMALAGLFSLVGCIDDEKDGLPLEPDTSPKPTRYGALGNSLTAGFINGGLIEGGQVASYPQLIAAQAGWDTPSLPIIGSPGFGSPNAQGIPQTPIFITPTGALITENVLDPLALLRNSTWPVPYDNLGIPGATTADLLNATSSATSQSGNNPFFDVVLRNSALPPGTFTPLDAIEARNPRAISLWIGANDILGGALGGNPQVGVNITPPAIWEQLFEAVVERVDAMGAEYVVVADIPNITDIPYCTTIPPALGPGASFNTVEEDVAHVLLPFGLFLASNPDTISSFIAGIGTSEIPSNWTLTQQEAADITNTSLAYQAIIERECQARGWGYVNAVAEMAALPNNPAAPEFGVTNALFPWFPVFEPGGISFIRNSNSAFSLDGVHPSELGQGLIANAFIRALNEAYGLGIAEIDLETISNEVGFEEAPSPGLTGTWNETNPTEFDSRSASGSSPDVRTWSADGIKSARAAIENLPELLGLGQ